MANDSHLTETEYINKLTALWGEEYVDDLIHRGYLPIRTNEGWRWLLVVAAVATPAAQSPATSS